VESCTIITMNAHPMMAEIHNAKQRMPAILSAEDIQQWPSGSAENAVAALRPYPAELMVAWPVGSRVNSPKNNSAELIVPKP
jgi:putative SOS response-associated peptidase YedK